MTSPPDRRPGARPLASALVVAALVAGCGGQDNAEPPPDDAADATATTTATTTTTTTVTTTTTSTATTTTTTATTTATTTTEPPVDDAPAPNRVRPPLELDTPAQRIVVLGDSLLANTEGLPGGRYNGVIDAVEERLREHPLLGDVEVTNQTRPGQAILVDSFVESGEGEHNLVEYAHRLYDDPDPATAPDLVIIAASTIDVSVVPIESVDGVLPGVMTALDEVTALLNGAGIAVAILPGFPVSGPLFDRAFGTPQHAEERIDLLNAALTASDLPLLFEAFPGTDVDRVPGADIALFEGFADPPDGVHLGPHGEAFYAEALAVPLEQLLLTGLLP